jgi:hypothetical protein
MDETGVLANAPDQPFFGLGMMKVGQTATLYSELNKLMSRAKSKISPRFEFKFNQIKNSNRDLYIEVVDLFFAFPELYFKAFIADKQNPRFNFTHYFPSTWEAQIGYSKLLLRNTIKPDEQAAVVADYLDRPKASPLYFESEIAKLARPKGHRTAAPLVFNSCMLESDASLFVQLVDVLLGLVVYDCKMQRGVVPSNAAKQSVTAVLKKHLGVTSLYRTLDVTKPPYFGVWVFSPK